MFSTNLTLILYYVLILGMLGFTGIMLWTAIPNIMTKTPFVPTSQRIVKHVIRLAKLKKGEKVYDLGCGDGRFLIEANKQTGTPATGYENAVLPYLISRIKQWISGGKIQVFMQNFFKVSLAEADVIYCYLAPEVMPKIAEKIVAECKKGTRIYCHTFRIPAMEPAQVWPRDKAKRLPSVYLYQL